MRPTSPALVALATVATILFLSSPLRVSAAEFPDPDAAAQLGLDAARGACSRTTNAALRACRSEADDDYWIGLGNCHNLSNPIEKQQCIAENNAARLEARELCDEQSDGRDDVCDELGEAPYDPEVDPGDFLSLEEAEQSPNPYFPLIRGTRWVYEKDEERIEVTVTEETVSILGIECFVVKDVVSEDGVVVEDTDDWYAMDEDGNVWYMGEISRNYEDGQLVSLDGSWKAGVDGAKFGIIMFAAPEIGETYRQEFFLGDAEDLAEVLSLTGTEDVPVPAAVCNGDCVVTRDFTPIEPGHESHKYYKPGIGLVLGLAQDSDAREELVEYYPVGGAAAQWNQSSTLQLEVLPSMSASAAGSRIRFALAEADEVSVDIYDAAGRRIWSQPRSSYEAGVNTVEWDATASNDQRAAPGVYFVQVRAGRDTESKKLVVIR